MNGTFRPAEKAGNEKFSIYALTYSFLAYWRYNCAKNSTGFSW
jgi:hypothetical protein